MTEIVLVTIDVQTQAKAGQLVSDVDGKPIGAFKGGNVERFREFHAMLVTRIAEAAPRLIAIDVTFGAGHQGEASNALARALDAADQRTKTVIAVDPEGSGGHPGIYGCAGGCVRRTGHIKVNFKLEITESWFSKSFAQGEPGISLQTEAGGKYPVVPLCQAMYAVLAGDAAAAAKVQQLKETWPTGANTANDVKRMRDVIPARPGTRKIVPISAAQLFGSPSAAARLRGAAVVVGFDIPGYDQHPLVPGKAPIPGVFAHCWALRSFIHGK